MLMDQCISANVISLQVKQMVLEFIFTQTETHLLVIGTTVINTEKVNFYILTKESFEEIGY